KKQFKLAFANTASLSIAISEFIGAGDWRLLFWTRDRVEALTVTDVTKAAEGFLQPSNRTLGMFYPTKAPGRAPQKELPDVAAVIKDYKGKPPEADGERFDATLANIEKRTVRRSLPSGMKLAVLNKTTR